MKKSFIPLALFITLALVCQAAFAKLIYVKEIPGGSANKCANCHTAGQPPVKMNLNSFGKDFAANGKVWNAALAKKDSDGDGMTNGQELGDLEGSWKKGDADKPGAVFNPGDAASHK